MIRFEQFLLDNGYIKFELVCKKTKEGKRTFKFEEPKYHTISTMVNIDHRYFPKSDPIINKIKLGKKIIVDGDNEISYKDRKNEIIIGLHEKDKPITLIYPRPFIEITRNDVFDDSKDNEYLDNNMNIVLEKIDHNEIFEAMYDKNKIIKIKL